MVCIFFKSKDDKLRNMRVFSRWGETVYLIKVAWWLWIHKVKLEEDPKYFWIKSLRKKNKQWPT